jgi:hypothetical protein
MIESYNFTARCIIYDAGDYSEYQVPFLLWNQKFRHRLHKSPNLDRIFSRFKSVINLDTILSQIKSVISLDPILSQLKSLINLDPILNQLKSLINLDPILSQNRL